MPCECSVPDSFCDKPSDVEKEGQLATMPEDYLLAWETAEVDGKQVETLCQHVESDELSSDCVRS